MKLDIGAGAQALAGYTAVDRKIGSEAYPLAFPDESAEEIRASHVLEHFDWRTVPKVLADWLRVLKPGGTIKVAVPNMEYVASNLNHPQALLWAMGGQTDANDYHRSAFTPQMLTNVLTAAGFENVQAWASDAKDCSSLPCSLNLMATKPVKVAKPTQTERPLRIQAVMSMPRVGFTENIASLLSSLGTMGIPCDIQQGAFWGQCMERGLTNCVKEGMDWIVAIDYDTVFKKWQLEALLELMAENPQADAIAPYQARREEDYCILSLEDTQGARRQTVKASELDAPLIEASTAHFGLKVFRVEALARMKHPWFIGVPNKDGEWGEGRIDDDIFFWQRFREAGNKLYMANQVSIGHAQLMVSWVNDEFRPVHQYLSDYRKNGPPKMRRFTQQNQQNSPFTPSRTSPTEGAAAIGGGK